jgi:GTP-binding protein
MTKADRRTGGQTDSKRMNSKSPPEVTGGFSSSGLLPDRSAVRLSDVEFVGTFPDPTVRLDPPLPEIAFVGRSNVGKSSLINALLGRPGIARVSATPGKTRALNVFRLPEFYLVDLPGYGYAKADKTTRGEIHRILDRYILERASVAGIVWLLDVRREPSLDDERMAQLFGKRGHPVLAVLTKADKLAHSAQLTRARVIGRCLGLEHDQVQLTSSATGLGIAELVGSVADLVRSRREQER